MFEMRDFPILEFDPSRDPFIKPGAFQEPVELAGHCVLCFFSEAIAALLEQYPHEEKALFKAESLELPVYVVDYRGVPVTLLQAAVGSPLAVMQVDELVAMGVRKIAVCGSCGVMRPDIAVGHLIVPTAAVRDEGASYHYAPPSREITADPQAVAAVERSLTAAGAPYIKAKTWTTDAIYRETPDKIALRKREGCVTVEMEASAYMAAARYNGVRLGQILYAGDNLGGEEWDSRDYNKRGDIRETVLRLTMDACLEME